MSGQVAVDEASIIQALRRVFQFDGTQSWDFTLQTPLRVTREKSVTGTSGTEISAIAKRLNEAKKRDESSFQWENEAEFSLVSLDQIGAFDRFFEDREFTGQGDNPVTFRFGRPSREFAAYLLCTIMQNDSFMRSGRGRMILNRIRGGDYRSPDVTLRPRSSRQPLEVESLFDVIAEGLRATTLRITATKANSDFETLANSFLFHAAYNIDAAARIGLESWFRPQTTQRNRRTQADMLEAPRQTYDTDLVHHYLMGVAAEIPLLEYLAYYHIAEHFFDKVFNEDLVNQVRSSIADPSFSARRTKDIQSVIRIVTKVQRQVKNEGGVNEQRSLQLVLDRFVDVPRLAADLVAYDATLVDYYNNNEAPFAGANKVNFHGTDEDVTRGAIAKRIYKVRNALVHAKEGELPKYAPFAHDEELAREIPLMRFTAEQIVIAHGKVL
ncbi:hypothetical protein [Streptomyces hirsutus]|uniref:hypothetical protein n=1 Tax=Streptomyces hirsutus TaxID=35620 RepID=UPI0036ACA1AC